MSLDPQAQKILENIKELNLDPLYMLTVNNARKRMNDAFITKENKENVFQVKDILVPCPSHDLLLRVYKPNDKKKLPILLFFHGGGWTLNNIETHDSLCRSISNSVNCIVVSVDYRLAPEHKFPAAIDDAYTSLQWVFDNAQSIGGDNQKIAVGGDSSGANQAAVCCLLSRDRGGPKPLFQWLAYPVTNYIFPGSKSYETKGKGYSLDRNTMIWFWNNYLHSNTLANNPYISPLQAEDHSNLPRAYILSANYDPLRDEAESYAKKLQDAGVQVLMKRCSNQMHGFLMQRNNIDSANKIFSEIVLELRKLFIEK